VVYVNFAQEQLCDEPGHMEAVYHLAQGKPGLPETMPMMPGYHWTVVALGLGQPTLLTARFTSTLFGLSGILAFAAAWRILHCKPAGMAALLFCLLPILQPFTGMAYSDAAGVATLLWAAWAQIAGHRKCAALLFGVAACVRQTNLIWVGFFAVWELRPLLQIGKLPTASELVATAWKRCRWLILLALIAAAVVASAGRLTPGKVHGNALQANWATLHFAGWLWLALMLPILVLGTPTALAALRSLLGRRPIAGGALALASALAVVGLVHVYRNPHLWNQVLSWPDVRFTLLRNWPLVATDRYPLLRYLSAGAVVLAAWAFAWTFRIQVHRLALWLGLGFSAVLLSTNLLVEPRYFITPAALLLLFLDLDRRTCLWLAGWFLLLDLLHGPFIVNARALW